MASNITDDAFGAMTIDVNSTSANGSAQDGNATSADIMQFYNHFAPVAMAVDRMITPVFYCIGIPCNPLCAFIWLGRNTRRSNSSAIYLGALSISHTVFLILHIFIELRYAWDIKTFDGHVSCELFYTVYYFPQYLAPLLVLGFTVERYIAVCYPFVKERYCTVRRAVMVVVALVVCCFLLSCVQAYLWTFDVYFNQCNHRKFLQNSNFPQLWTWFTELVIFGIAPLAALVFNVLVIREIRSITLRGPAAVVGLKSGGGGGGGGGGSGGGSGGGGGGSGGGGGQNQASTMTLLTVSFYLICTWLPATIVYSLEREFPLGDQLPPHDADVWDRHLTYYTVRKVVEEVTLSNSACYFFIYYLTGKHFRTRFREVMCPSRCLKRHAGAQQNGATWLSHHHHSNDRGNLNSKHYIAVPNRSDNGHDKTCVTNV